MISQIVCHDIGVMFSLVPGPCVYHCRLIYALFAISKGKVYNDVIAENLPNYEPSLATRLIGSEN